MISHEVRWWYISVVQAHLWPNFRVIHLFFVVFQPLSSGLKKSIIGNGLRKTIPNHTTEWVCRDVGLGIWLNTIKEKSPLNHYSGQENRFPVSKSGLSVILLTNLGYIWSEETRDNGFFLLQRRHFWCKKQKSETTSIGLIIYPQLVGKIT